MVDISAKGKWVDSATGAVVETEPETGRQLVAPGGVLTDDTKAAIAAAELAAADPVRPVETVTLGAATETATAPDSTRKAKK